MGGDVSLGNTPVGVEILVNLLKVIILLVLHVLIVLLGTVPVHVVRVELHLVGLHVIKGDCGKGRLVLLGIEGGLGLLDGVLEGVDDGAVGGQLVHVGLHKEHFGAVDLEDVQGGGECWRQSPQSRLPR
jgi:hypothetical protein